MRLSIKRQSRIIFCSFISFVLMISFQNCAKPFKPQVEGSMELASSDSSLPSTSPSDPSSSPSAPLPPGSGVPSIPVPVYNSTAVPATLTGGGFEVFPGCELPPASYARTLYFDPVNGNDSTGNGSFAKPYAKVGTFISSKLVKAGDHLILLKGDHGSISANSASMPALLNTTSWIWIDGQAGAIVGQINLQAVSRWLITGVDVTGVMASGTANLYEVAVTSSSHVIFAKSKIYPAADSSAWTFSDWMLNNTAVFSRNSQCATYYQNDIRNVRFGIIMQSDAATYPSNSLKTLVKLNNIDGFSADAMRVIGSDLLVQRNQIKNIYLSAADGDANHDDAIQGYALKGAVFENVYVDGNYIQESTDPNRQFNASMQGFSIFDGLYRNVVAVNNVIITSAYHGISFFGTEGGLIEHNTLASPINRSLWISVPKSKPDPVTGVVTPPKNVVVKNNIVAAMGTIAGNTVTSNNIVVTNEALNFVKFDLITNTFDLHLLTTSPAYGAGAGAY